MWKIYSRNNDSIAIKTTVGDLREALLSSNNFPEDTELIINDVAYVNDYNKLLKYYNQIDFKNFDFNNQVWRLLSNNSYNRFFIKRKSFEHEHEVRVLLFIKSLLNRFEPDEKMNS